MQKIVDIELPKLVIELKEAYLTVSLHYIYCLPLNTHLTNQSLKGTKSSKVWTKNF